MVRVATRSISRSILAEIVAFVKRTGISEHNFGMLAINDPRLTYMLSKGYEYEAETINRVRLFIQMYDENKERW